MTLYGLIIAIAVFTGFSVTLRCAPKFGTARKNIENLFLLSAPFAIIGARLYHVLSEFPYYQKSPVEALYFWQGGWGIFGAIAGGVLALFLYTFFKKLSFWTILNLATPGVVLGQTIGRLGNIVNGELLPYAIFESILNFSIFLFLLRRKPINNETMKQFNNFSLYAIMYGTGRFLLEFLRTEPAIFWGLKLNQIVSLFLVVFGILSKLCQK